MKQIEAFVQSDKLRAVVNAVEKKKVREVHQKLTDKYDALENKGIVGKFGRWNKKRKINKIDENNNSVEHRGAAGEVLALEKLSELSDDYHVFCGVNKELKNYVNTITDN